jgi:hypothetical protein
MFTQPLASNGRPPDLETPAFTWRVTTFSWAQSLELVLTSGEIHAFTSLCRSLSASLHTRISGVSRTSPHRFHVESFYINRTLTPRHIGYYHDNEMS